MESKSNKDEENLLFNLNGFIDLIIIKISTIKYNKFYYKICLNFPINPFSEHSDKFHQQVPE